MYWIYDYPSWMIGLLFGAAFVAATTIGIFLTRRTVHCWIHRDHRANEMVSFALANFFVLFGLLLGLLAVATFQDYSTVGDVIDKEASSIGALYRDFGGYPPPVRAALRDRLQDYVRCTIEEDWPQQRNGVVPAGGSRKITSLANALFAFEPVKKSEEIIHAEALRQFNHLIELRRSRLSDVAVGLPAILWWVVAFGALINVVLICLQDMEIHVHMILGAAMSSFLGAVIFLTAALDNPFRGVIGAGPDSIELVYQSMMKEPPEPT